MKLKQLLSKLERSNFRTQLMHSAQFQTHSSVYTVSMSICTSWFTLTVTCDTRTIIHMSGQGHVITPHTDLDTKVAYEVMKFWQQGDKLGDVEVVDA